MILKFSLSVSFLLESSHFFHCLLLSLIVPFNGCSFDFSLYFKLWIVHNHPFLAFIFRVLLFSTLLMSSFTLSLSFSLSICYFYVYFLKLGVSFYFFVDCLLLFQVRMFFFISLYKTADGIDNNLNLIKSFLFPLLFPVNEDNWL